MIYEIYSFDFDGCLANLLYLSSKKKDIIRANQVLLAQIKSSPNPKIILVGSNRQGLMDDFTNAADNERGSCFPAIKLISQELNSHEAPTTLDELLLSDIYNDMPDGASFKEAMKYINKNNKDYKVGKIKKPEQFPNWIHDESKLTVIYAQMHKMAKEHPYDDLQFNFIDDREDILNHLHDYFLKYPELIPHNVTLNLKRYMGPIDKFENPIDPLVTEYAPIKGTRPEADHDYRQTVKMMAAVTIEQMNAHDYYLCATKAKSPIQSYEEAKKYNYNISVIKAVGYYKPGMMPINPPELTTPKKSRFGIFGKSFFSSKNLTSEMNSSSYSSTPSLSIPSSSKDPSPKPGFSYASSSTSNSYIDDDSDPVQMPKHSVDFELGFDPIPEIPLEEIKHETHAPEYPIFNAEQLETNAVTVPRAIGLHRLFPPMEGEPQEIIVSEPNTETGTSITAHSN
ncbi:hypothetical protein [Legionella bononiensis]|uniref:Dot/Icm T4SS effector n=1 Tax=Legionella bononiensis TaxID=2793102 RepID=A0ABS1WBT9_9GAMM|nr:hypothetical protein [Legionella bononiensis]MBL7481111.1 hypothetical protein [Legionella bononiensis]MBL7526820.1 hypothetical protein [Legionella bononiensis]MBL7564227.1 hypothetical protein [Legionella bononiensis]